MAYSPNVVLTLPCLNWVIPIGIRCGDAEGAMHGHGGQVDHPFDVGPGEHLLEVSVGLWCAKLLFSPLSPLLDDVAHYN